ncbi:MAG: hypothetical protein WB586_26505 [Chthoniobacterales bacterium]
MKSVERWSPKLKPEKQPGQDDIVEFKEQLPLSRFVAIVASGVLILVGTGAILAIWVALPKKSVTHKLDTAEQVVQNVQPDTVAVESKPANPDLPARTTSEQVSSVPTQDLVIKGIPGNPYQSTPTRKRTRERKFKYSFSLLSQKSRSGPNNKMHWPRGFVMYLEAHEKYLRAILTPGAATTPNSKSSHRGSDSFLASLSKPLN